MALNAPSGFADQKGREPLNGLFDYFRAIGNGTFANASYAAVCFQFQKEIIAIADGMLASGEILASEDMHSEFYRKRLGVHPKVFLKAVMNALTLV